jgi:hypothetical protein
MQIHLFIIVLLLVVFTMMQRKIDPTIKVVIYMILIFMSGLVVYGMVKEPFFMVFDKHIPKCEPQYTGRPSKGFRYSDSKEVLECKSD